MLLCVFILVLVLATILKRYQRIILWSAAIVIFTGTLLLIGFGIIDPVTDNRLDSVVITGVAFAFFFSGALAYGAEKLHAKMREKDRQILQNASIQQEEQNGVVLTGRLDTHIARKIFAKAIEAGYMEEVGSHYEWKNTKTLLAYMCGRIYCGDKPEYSKIDRKSFWTFGEGLFPDVELGVLFKQNGIGQLRQNRRDEAVPNNADIIDKLFR